MEAVVDVGVVETVEDMEAVETVEDIEAAGAAEDIGASVAALRNEFDAPCLREKEEVAEVAGYAEQLERAYEQFGVED